MITAHSTPPAVIGHRGAAAHAPENTIGGFEAAYRLGCTWVEFDVGLTADRRAVLMHDDTLMRTTGAPGRLAETALADVVHLDAGAWFGPGHRGQWVPTLDDAIAALETYGLGANVEIKPTPGTDVETARVAAETVRDRWPAALPSPLLSSFSAVALAQAFATAPELDRAFLVDHADADAGWERVCDDLGCAALHVDQRHVTPRLIDRAARRGLAVRAYTVNAPARAARLFAWGVTGVFSDRPERLFPLIPKAHETLTRRVGLPSV